LKIEELNKKIKAFDVIMDCDINNLMSQLKLNDLHLNEIESEDIEHLEESNKKRFYIGQRVIRTNKSNTESMPLSRKNTSMNSKMPPKLNLKIKTLENLNTDSDKLFLQEISKKKIDKSNIESRASNFRSRNTSG
jgi:hypothetical protein